MAAEIAAGLVVGGSCPVCGSCDHPHKAAAAAGAPDETRREGRAEGRRRRGRHRVARQTEVRDLDRRARARPPSGVDIGPARDRHRDRRRRRVASTPSPPRRRALEAELAGYDEDRLAGLRTPARARRPLRADRPRPRSAPPRPRSTDAEPALTGAARRRRVRLRRRRARRPRSTSSAYDDLAHRLAEHDRRLAAVAAVLAEPGADDGRRGRSARPARRSSAPTAPRSPCSATPAPASSSGRTRARRLGTLVAELDAALAAWAPAARRPRAGHRLSAFVEGKAPDNRLQMRLSAYVLAYRLSQVVAAANERLAGMSDQRYSLEHTGRRGAGETRGGLSLLVRDDWSGETRDPATLSGGETFVVSLALALGLADVVTQEAGGADLDTLFVDEGFGSLDADTLDDVMDTLDSLRDGGRVGRRRQPRRRDARPRSPPSSWSPRHGTGSTARRLHPLARRGRMAPIG